MAVQPEIKGESTERYGEFTVEPLQRGFGHPGQPAAPILLLVFIPGTAVTSVYIEDVLHEFSTIRRGQRGCHADHPQP